MKHKWWLVYVILYLSYEAWAFSLLPEFNILNISNILYLIMLTGIVGLALQRKLINIKLWRIIFMLNIIFLIHGWVIMPIVFYNDGVQLTDIGLIQLFSTPSLPIIIGLYIYAWRSPNIWAKSVQQGS